MEKHTKKYGGKIATKIIPEEHKEEEEEKKDDSNYVVSQIDDEYEIKHSDKNKDYIPVSMPDGSDYSIKLE
jgi:hypothetical protein